jgi:hypothetical protein
MGSALALVVRQARSERRAGDALLLALFWPLYGPLLLARLRDQDHGTALSEVAFLVALRRARRTPLGALLPDESTVRALARRLRVAAGKVAEIDGLLGRPEFSEAAAVDRVEELRARSASENAVSTAGIRVQNIRRLRTLRDRFARELDEVRELLAQLETQAEVVRLAGAPDASTTELVRELVSRVEGFDRMLDDDPQLEAPAA